MDNPVPEGGATEKRQRLPIIPVLLFAVTLLTTLGAGALQQGVNPFEDPAGLLKGVPFSFTLLLILGSHEFGHYYLARRNNVETTLPFFIPAPSIIGTFGAVIRMKSPIMDRRSLLEIGAAGPLIGVIVTLPVLVLGLYLSKVEPIPSEGVITLGSSALLGLLSYVVHGPLPEGMDVIFHPFAFSGWIGLLVTSLNLMPVGQLDGGHVAYALFGSRQKQIAWIFMVILVVLGLTGSVGWLVWAAILYFLVGVKHPPVYYEWIPLDRRHKVIGWVTILIFAATFTPVPF